MQKNIHPKRAKYYHNSVKKPRQEEIGYLHSPSATVGERTQVTHDDRRFGGKVATVSNSHIKSKANIRNWNIHR